MRMKIVCGALMISWLHHHRVRIICQSQYGGRKACSIHSTENCIAMSCHFNCIVKLCTVLHYLTLHSQQIRHMNIFTFKYSFSSSECALCALQGTTAAHWMWWLVTWTKCDLSSDCVRLPLIDEHIMVLDTKVFFHYQLEDCLFPENEN